MKTVQYDTGLVGLIPLSVLKENSDGTLELGDENGNLKVGKCPGSPEPKAGHYLIVAPEKVAASTDSPIKK